MHRRFLIVLVLVSALLPSFSAENHILIRNGLIYDGTGRGPFKGDVGINGQKIAAIGQLKNARGKTEMDAKGWPSRRDSSTC